LSSFQVLVRATAARAARGKAVGEAPAPPSSPPREKQPPQADTDSDSDRAPIVKKNPPAVRGGRKKAQATVRDVPVPRTTHKDIRERKRTDHYTPPDTARVIVAKKRKQHRQESPPAVNTHEIPISVQSNRAMAGHLEINKRFPKTYMSTEPIKDAPLPNMTLSGTWHAVSCKYLLQMNIYVEFYSF
jgi:hypothetical protein